MFFKSFALMGLAALATAAPRPDVPLEERGLTWNPRALEARGGNSRNNNDRNNNNNNDLVIVDTTFVQIDEKTRGREQELTILIKEKTIIRDNSNRFRDNVRRNHYRSKNRNVNTVIIIVTNVIDIRDSNNRNTRYMQRQIRADNGRDRKDDVVVIVTEVVAITIDGSNNGRGGRNGGREEPTGSNRQIQGTGVASASIPILTVEPNAPYKASNLTVLSPSGASAPAPQGVSQELDPARILEADQLLFVSEAS